MIAHPDIHNKNKKIQSSFSISPVKLILALPVLRKIKSYGIVLLLRRCQQPFDMSIQIGDMAVMFLKLPHNVFMCGKKLSQADERSHNRNVDVDSTVGMKDARKHGNALLREHIGRNSPSAAPLVCYSNLEFQRFVLFRGQLEHKIIRKAPDITFYRFVQITRRYAIQFRKIGVQHHFGIANKVDFLRNTLNRHDMSVIRHALWSIRNPGADKAYIRYQAGFSTTTTSDRSVFSRPGHLPFIRKEQKS